MLRTPPTQMASPRQDLPTPEPQSERIAIGTIIGFSLLVAMQSVGSWCGWSTDCFSFLRHARFLAETGGFPAERVNVPPGYPLLIAPFMLLFGQTPILAIRLLSATAVTFCALATYYLHRRRLGSRSAWIAALLVAGSPVLLRLSATPLSEPLFTAGVCVLLVLGQRWTTGGVRGYRDAMIAGLATAAVVCIRSMGIALLPAMAVAALRIPDRTLRFRVGFIAVLTLTTVLPLAAWELRQSAYPATFGYQHAWTHAREAEATDATGLALQAERLARFGPIRLAALKALLLPGDLAWRLFQPPFDSPTTWLIGGGVVGLGIVLAAARRSASDVYVLLTLLMLALWPYDEGTRFVAPLLPIVIAYPFVAVRWLQARVSRPVARVGLTTALSVWVVTQAAGLAYCIARMPQYRAKQVALWNQITETTRWQQSTITGDSFTAVLPEGDNTKLVLAGAAYLTRATIRYVDCIPGNPIVLGSAAVNTALVHTSLVERMREGYGLIPESTHGSLTLMRPAPSLVRAASPIKSPPTRSTLAGGL